MGFGEPLTPSQAEATERSWYTPAELARLVDVGQPAILNRLRRGTLRGEKHGGRWRIPSEVAQAAIAAYQAQAVSSGSVRMLRGGEGVPSEAGPSQPAVDAQTPAQETMQRLVAAKDEVIAAKDLVIQQLRQELASQRAAMVVLMGGTPTPAPESASGNDVDPPAGDR